MEEFEREREKLGKKAEDFVTQWVLAASLTSVWRKSAEWQRLGNQIEATFIFARSDLISVFHFRGLCGNRLPKLSPQLLP